jgi:hypothetical protein
MIRMIIGCMRRELGRNHSVLSIRSEIMIPASTTYVDAKGKPCGNLQEPGRINEGTAFEAITSPCH